MVVMRRNVFEKAGRHGVFKRHLSRPATIRVGQLTLLIAASTVPNRTTRIDRTNDPSMMMAAVSSLGNLPDVIARDASIRRRGSNAGNRQVDFVA